MALDAMIESVREDMRENDPGNHATIGALNGELKGLMAARTYVELDSVRSHALENAEPGCPHGMQTGGIPKAPCALCEADRLAASVPSHEQRIHEGRRSPPAGALVSGSLHPAARDANPGSAVPGGVDDNGPSELDIDPETHPAYASSTTRRSDCPLENCEKTGQCEFPQDCDAPSPATPRSGETPIADAAGLWLMAEGPLPADWKCPPGQEADIRRFDHELLGPCTEWKVVTAAVARRLERKLAEAMNRCDEALEAAEAAVRQRDTALSATACSKDDVLEEAALVCEARAKDDEYTGGEKAGLHYAAFNIRALKNSPDGGTKDPCAS